VLNWPARVIPSTEGMKLCVFLTLAQRVLKKGTSRDFGDGRSMLNWPDRVNPSPEGKLKVYF
jgi:hypothetical protein